MKKVGSIILGFLMVVGAVLIREITAGIGMIVYSMAKAISENYPAEKVPELILEIPGQPQILIAVSALGTLVWILVFGIIYRHERRLKDTAANTPVSWKSAAVLLFMGFGLQFLINSILGTILKIAPDALNNYAEIVNTLGMGNTLLSFLFIVLIAPVGEELVFRGVLLSFMKNRVSFITANIFQALFFGIYHMNLVQGLYAFVLGMLLGWAAQRYGKLRASILLHMGVNFSGCVASAILPDAMVETYPGLAALFTISLLILVFTIKFVTIETVNTRQSGDKDITGDL